MSKMRAHDVGLIILRMGLAAVFLWFGFTQLGDPSSWTGFLPGFVAEIGIAPVKFVLLNGWFEIVAAALLILGCYTRITALLLALHLFGIAATIGITAVGVRDIGLAFSTLGLAFLGAGPRSLDARAEREAPSTLL